METVVPLKTSFIEELGGGMFIGITDDILVHILVIPEACGAVRMIQMVSRYIQSLWMKHSKDDQRLFFYISYLKTKRPLILKDNTGLIFCFFNWILILGLKEGFALLKMSRFL